MEPHPGMTSVEPRVGAPASPSPGEARCVLLATCGRPIDQKAAEIALASALDSMVPLVIVNVTELEPLALSVTLGYDSLPEFDPAVTQSIEALVGNAATFGIRVDRLRVRSPRPAQALLELIAEHHPGLVVFGPAGPVKSRLLRSFRAALAGVSDCLVWQTSDP